MNENQQGENTANKPFRTFRNFWTGLLEGAGKWIEAHPLWAAAHFLNLLAGFVLFIIDSIKNLPDFPPDFPILTVVIAMCIIFVQIYTDPIESLPIEESNQNGKGKINREEIERKRSVQRNKWMIFAYSFMLLSLLLTFYPFINPLFDTKPDADNSSPDQVKQTEKREEGESGSEQNAQGEQSSKSEKNEYLRTLRERPIAVFIGCTLDSKAKNLRCEEPKKENAPGPSGAELTPSGDGQSKPPTQPVQPTQAISSVSVGHAWVINIGGYLQECNLGEESSEYGKSFTCKVRDGLLIPLYFIILALMGGSISLTRRLPELQKQVGTEHVATPTQPKLTQYEFREYLIFQMVQFISAPFLAILAYYLIEPNNTTQAVVLAFTAGFASETILLMIRSLANKITPETTKLPQYGSVAGIVTYVNPEKPADKLEVLVSELPQIQSITDEKGFYVLSNIPVGEHSITIKSLDKKVLKKDTIKIERAQAIVKKNVIIEQRPEKVPE